MNGLHLQDSQWVYLDGAVLSGVSAVRLGYDTPIQQHAFLGEEIGHDVIVAPVTQSVGFQRSMFYVDPVLTLTGDIPTSGRFQYDTGYYEFSSGYLTDYSVTCSLGQVPVIDASLQVFEEMTSDGLGAVSAPDSPLTNISGDENAWVPTQGSISLAGSSQLATNRVTAFSYNVSVGRVPSYTLGSKVPSQVLRATPAQVAAEVNVELDDYFLQSGFHFLENNANQTLTITIKSDDGSKTLSTLNVPRASLIAEGVSSDANGRPVVTLRYIGNF